MASTRTEQGALITDAATNGFLNQVIGSVMNAVQSILFEGAVTDHDNRLLFARALIATPTPICKYMLPGYLQSSAIVAVAGAPATIVDADVDTQTASMWNTYADQYATQLQSGTPLQFGS